MTIRQLIGDCRSILPTLAAESVHCVVTSPPYFGLRDYGVAGQIGLEPTPDTFVAELVAVFREVRRVLRKDGTLWLNLGDSYAAVNRGENARPRIETLTGIQVGNPYSDIRTRSEVIEGQKRAGIKPKDLIGIPWRVAFALQADGWWLRQDIIWHKPNPMPESVTDRCTKAHEYLFLLTKSERYFYDAEAIAEPVSRDFWNESVGPEYMTPTDGRMDGGKRKGNGPMNGTRNKRSVWTIATQPYSEAHFATFPPALIEPCILAGCPAKACAKCGAPWVREVETTPAVSRTTSRINGDRNDAGRTQFVGASAITFGFSPSCACNASTVPGTVLDPFSGAGTTGLVADRLQRNAVLIELNANYASMSNERIISDAPLFASVIHGPS